MENLSLHFLRKLKRIKLVATDLDGTLLDDRGLISDETRESAGKMKEIGILLAIMTARAHSSAERIADDLGMETPIISMDGGLVRLPHSNENIFSSYIPSRIVKRVISEAEEKFASVVLFVDDKMVRLGSDFLVPGYIESLELDTIEADDLNPFADRTIRVVISSGSKDAIKAMSRNVGGIFSRVGASIYGSPHEERRWYLEIKNRNYSKATGLGHLEKHLGIRRDELAVLGDFKNDIEAFDRAGVGVAVKNAVWELKEKADWVTSRTNDGGGASEFFELVYRVRTNHQQ